MDSSLPGLVDEWINDKRVRSARGLSDNSERGYRTDLAEFARRHCDLQGLPSIEYVADATSADGEPVDRWARQNHHLRRIESEAFTDEHLKAVFAQMIDEGKSNATRARMLAALRGFTTWLRRNGIITTDPTLHFDTPARADRLPVALSDDQLAEVFRSARHPDAKLRACWAARDVAMLGVLAGCGIRSEELTTLTLNRIQRSEPSSIRVIGKGKKERTVPLSPEVLAAIDTYLEERKNRKGLRPKNKSAVVFIRTDGRPLDNRALQHLTNNWLRAVGVAAPPGEKVHLFRHTYAMGQMAAGTTLVELQALMGHASASTTAIYLRVQAEGLHHTANATAVNTLITDGFDG